MYFIDVQGTLISDEDKTPIEGSVEFVRKLRETNTPFMLITNNTKTSSKEFLRFLQRSGFDVEERHYIDPLTVLTQSVVEKKIAAYGTRQFVQNIQALGYKLDYTTPEAVLVAIKKDFTADEYADMIEFLLSGAKLVGMHETSLYAKEGKRYPGVGAILKMLSFATQKNYEVVGKPSELFYKKALEKLKSQDKNATFDTITIISDDVTGDLVGAKKLGMKTVFVTSGKFKNANEIIFNLPKEQRPDQIYPNIGELL